MKHTSKLFALCLFVIAGPFPPLNGPLLAQLPRSDKQAAVAELKKQEAKPAKDYRIEEDKDQEGRQLRVKFMSPEGKVIKTLPYREGMNFKGTLIPESKKHVLYAPEEYMSDAADAAMTEQGYLNFSLSLYGVKGDIKWKKEFKTYPQYLGIEGAEDPWDNGISADGERVYVNYCDEKSSHTLTVFNAEGREVISIKHNLLLHGIEIATDGRIIGAETVKDGRKHLFFLEVDTGKTKLVKADGEGWYGEFIVNSLNPKISSRGKIYLNVTLRNEYETIKGITIPKTYRGYFVFSELPDDMTELIKKDGKGK